MSTSTPNYALIKPTEATDFVDIDVINGNMDKIDTQMKVNADAITAANSNITTNTNAINSEASTRSSADTALQNRCTALEADTGWKAITGLGLSFSGTCRYRIMGGKQVTFQIDGSASITDGGNFTLKAAGMPAEGRPTTLGVRAGAYLAGYSGVVTIGTNGDIEVSNNSGATRGSVSCTVTYLLG